MTSEIVDDFLRGDMTTEEISNRSFSELRRYVGIMWRIHQEKFDLLSSRKEKKTIFGQQNSRVWIENKHT